MGLRLSVKTRGWISVMLLSLPNPLTPNTTFEAWKIQFQLFQLLSYWELFRGQEEAYESQGCEVVESTQKKQNSSVIVTVKETLRMAWKSCVAANELHWPIKPLANFKMMMEK